MREGSVSKRCTCTEGGRRLGARCPKLRRPTGGWNPTHGTWGYQLELPAPPGEKRRQLRRSGFDSRDAAIAERDDARALLDLAGRDHPLAVEIGTLLRSCKPGTPLPDRDTIARRVRAGVPASTAITVADYLTAWLRGVQYLSIRYTERLAAAGAVASVGSKGDSYDNALAESFNGLYKAELIRRYGPWRSIDDVELATLEYLDWFNHRRLHSACHDKPPAEYEAIHYANQHDPLTAGKPK
jgi:integrase-like protein